MEELFLILFGGAVGTYGTITGVGGGFLLMPLLLTYFRLPHELAVGTSLAAVFCSVVVGVFHYWRQRAVDVKGGLVLGLSAVPGTWLGAWLIPHVDPLWIRRLFALLIFVLAVRLVRPGRSPEAPGGEEGKFRRRIETRDGRVHEWAYSLPGAVLAGFLTGVASGFLGIGGGVVLVPVLVQFFRFPPHVAVATSLFTLLFSSSSGALAFWVRGHVLLREAFLFGIGMVLGAQAGPRIAERARGEWILRLLAAGLVVIAARLLVP